MFKKYRKLPVVIEAVQITRKLIREAPAIDGVKFNSLHGHVRILTLEGFMIGNPGDWLIRGVKGEVYPCKDEIFKLTYELVNEGEGNEN